MRLVQLLTAAQAGVLAFCIARACGVDIWHTSRTLTAAGDATDIGVGAGCFVLGLLYLYTPKEKK